MSQRKDGCGRAVKPHVNERRHHPQHTGKARTAHHAVRSLMFLKQRERAVLQPSRAAEFNANTEAFQGSNSPIRLMGCSQCDAAPKSDKLPDPGHLTWSSPTSYRSPPLSHRQHEEEPT